jgi:hypothetical protein
MYKLLLIISALTTFCSQAVHACSCKGYVEEFCFSADTSDYIALVELIEFEDETAANFKLIENLHKKIPDTIAILGSDGFNCNLSLDNFSVGDTLVINVRFYQGGATNVTNFNTYHWGIPDCNRHYLEFSDGIVFGALDTFNVATENAYQDFKQQLFTCFDFTLSTAELDEDYFNIYPNPFTDYIHIEANEYRITDINLYNLKGEKLISLNLDKTNGAQIDIPDDNSGLYFLEIITTEGILRKRVVKI